VSTQRCWRRRGGSELDPLASLAQELNGRGVRYILIGVTALNFHSGAGVTLFATLDRDLLLPLDGSNLLQAWSACEKLGLDLLGGADPLDRSRDLGLARRVVDNRASTRATDGKGFDVDLNLVMSGFTYEEVEAERRMFDVDGVKVPVARATHVVRSKAAAGRPKDRLFMETHAAELRQLLRRLDDED